MCLGISILKFAAAVVLSGIFCGCTKGLDGDRQDLDNPGGKQETTFYVYDAPDGYAGVPKSSIYRVTVIQNGVRKESVVFQNTCPVWQEGYMDMTATDQYPLGIFAGRSISWTGFSFSGKVTVEVEVLDETKVPVTGNVRILPSRYGITPEWYKR